MPSPTKLGWAADIPPRRLWSTSFPFLKGETQPCRDLEKQRHPKKPSNCFWLVMWKQEPGQLLQNTLLTLISQTGTDSFWLSLRVHTPTCTDVRGELSCSGLQPPALTEPPSPSPTTAAGCDPTLENSWETKLLVLPPAWGVTCPCGWQKLVGSGKAGRKRWDLHPSNKADGWIALLESSECPKCKSIRVCDNNSPPLPINKI